MGEGGEAVVYRALLDGTHPVVLKWARESPSGNGEMAEWIGLESPGVDRILGKGIEIAFVKTIISLLSKDGFENLTASYLPTVKNAQVKDFWEKAGFSCTHESEEGNKDYVLALKYANLDIKEFYHITVK